MKILVYSHTNSFYGAPKSIFDLTNELKKDNNEVIYLIPDHGILEDNLIREKYEYVILANPQWIVSNRPPDYSRWYYYKHFIKSIFIFIWSIITAYRKNIKVVKDIKPNVIIVNTSVAPLGLYVAKRLKIKSVLWIREVLCNKPGVYVPTLFSRRYVGRVLNKADVIMGPSVFLKDYIERTFGISRMQVLPNAIDFIPKLSKELPAYKFGMVGSISERKGQLDFFMAMLKHMPEANLIIYGAGTNDYAQKLYKIASKYPEKINMYGYESDLNKIYSSFDIYVNMGIDETFGRTTVEAMRAGRLVFGRRSGATPEIIKNGENGFLFDKADEVFEILKKYDTDEGFKQLSIIRERGKNDSLKYLPESIIKKFMTIVKNHK